MSVKIIGIGSSLPENIVTNDDLSKVVETNDEWIKERTGIRKRRISKDETLVSLASDAAKKAIESAKIKPEDLDLIIVATISPENYMPSTACSVQDNIKAVNATCFDMSAACSGFVFSLITANAYISSNMAETILVIGAENLSKLIDWNDRSTCVLFGDGAGAAILTKDAKNETYAIHGTDGAKGNCLTVKARPINNLLRKSSETMDYIKMDGHEVFKFAVKKVPECIQQILDLSNTDINEIDYFILHQANERIINSVAKRLKVSADKFPMNLSEYGNTSGASIPILIDEMYKKKMFNNNNKVILAGFGGGLTWGSIMLHIDIN